MLTKIINWEKVFEKSNDFKNANPFKFGFIENIFQTEFYQKLFDTYPKLDKFGNSSDYSRSQVVLQWGKSGRKKVQEGDDTNLSEEWNLFKKYAESEEFISNIRDFSGVPVNKLKYFKFIAYRKGGYQLPHIHNVGPSTVLMMFYFSKGWNAGDPGGTYMAKHEDESSIIFEPDNLDNTVALFQDGPNSVHGVRLIEKDVERRAVALHFEEYDEKAGWSGGPD